MAPRAGRDSGAARSVPLDEDAVDPFDDEVAGPTVRIIVVVAPPTASSAAVARVDKGVGGFRRICRGTTRKGDRLPVLLWLLRGPFPGIEWPLRGSKCIRARAATSERYPLVRWRRPVLLLLLQGLLAQLLGRASRYPEEHFRCFYGRTDALERLPDAGSEGPHVYSAGKRV